MASTTETRSGGKTSTKRRVAPATTTTVIAKKPAAPGTEAGGPILTGRIRIRKGLLDPTDKHMAATITRRAQGAAITYARSKGIDAFISRVAAATPMELIEVERRGIASTFLKDLSKHMQMPAVRIFDIVGVPKATAEKKVAANEPIAGTGGQAALGLARLLAIANDIVAHSTAPEAKGFDAAVWLGQWIERPQPALGGRKPAELIGTPTGIEMVARVLGAIESGAYQ